MHVSVRRMIYLIQKMTVVVHEHKRLISGRAPMDIIISSKIDEFQRRLFKFLPDELESNSGSELYVRNVLWGFEMAANHASGPRTTRAQFRDRRNFNSAS